MLNEKQIGLVVGVITMSIFLFFSYPFAVSDFDKMLLGFGCIFLICMGFIFGIISKIEEV